MGGSGRGGATTRVGEFWQTIAAFSFVALSSPALAAEADDAQILYFEPLRLISSAPQATQKSSQSRELQFDAYGRRFVVSLQPNTKLSPLLQAKTGVAPVELYKGQINGASHSWARIAFVDGQPSGMLWDGAELYVVEPVAKLSDSLPANVPVSADTVAIFRLDDVVMKPGAASCGSDTNEAAASKGSAAYGSLLNELKSAPAIMQAAGASRRLEIAALGDDLFTNRYGTEARARSEILLRLNNVDGIFSHQLGIEIQVPSIDLGDSVSATTWPKSLLDELEELRYRSPNLHSRGLTHLFTGRDLDGNTVGIANVDVLCDRWAGVGITEASSRSLWTESLIAAHEIGHNFGASHDGDPKWECASTPGDKFLMGPAINNQNSNFSECSLQVMRPNIAEASCVTSLPAADLAVEPTFGVMRQAVGRGFEWNLSIANLGGLTTTNARAEIVMPPVIEVQEAFVIGGSCLSGAGMITCELGEIAGGSSTAINLILRSDVIGSNHVAVAVSTGNETQVANNSGDATIQIEPEADLALTLQAPASVANGASFNGSLSATNLSANPARNVTVTMTLPAGVTASAATFNGASCAIEDAFITCSLDSLASGGTVTGSVSLSAANRGDALLQARIAGATIDPVAANDSASATVAVVTSAAATTQSSSSSGGGGGGGSTGWPLLGALLTLVGLKNFQRRGAR